MNEEEIIEAISNLSDRSQIVRIFKYTESIITTQEGTVYDEHTEVCNFSYGNKPIEIEDFDLGELPWLK